MRRSARCQFLPYYRVHCGIPVPGMRGTTSDTVEGIWQGLKIIQGEIAPRLFHGPGRKRGGTKPSGHRYNRVRLRAHARHPLKQITWNTDRSTRVEEVLEWEAGPWTR